MVSRLPTRATGTLNIYSAEHSTEYKITQNTVNHKKVSKHKSYKYIPSNQNFVKIAHQSHWHAQYIQCRAQQAVQNHTEYSQSQKISKHRSYKYKVIQMMTRFSTRAITTINIQCTFLYAVLCTAQHSVQKKTENTDNHELKFPIKDQTNNEMVK